MLSQSTIVACTALAEHLAERSLSLQAKPNSVIAELNRTTNAAALDSVAIPDIANWTSFDSQAYGGFIEHITFNMDNPTQHDLSIQSFTDDLKQAVSSHIQFARNVVKPIVCDYAEKLNNKLQNTEIVPASDQFTISVYDEPEPFSDVVFEESVSHYRDMRVVNPELTLTVKGFEDNELLEYILTGDAEVDKNITAWWLRVQPYKSPATIIDMFTPNQVLSSLSLTDKLDYVLLAYLVSNALYNKQDRIDGEEQGLNSSRSICAAYRDLYGSMLVRTIDQLRMYIKNSMLILEMNAGKKTVVVQGDVYRKWLEKGGSPETLFGLIVSNSNYRNAQQIQDNIEKLNREWQSYNLFWINSQTNRRLDVVKDIAKLTFREIMVDLTAEEQEYVNSHSDYMTRVNQRLDVIVDNLKLSDVNDVNHLAMKLVCNCRFYYTDAESILSEIEEIAKQNPDIDVMEAAMIATIHYLVDYMCDQLYLTGKV